MDNKNKNAIEIYNQIAEDYSKAYDSIDGEEDLVFLNAFLSHLQPGSYLVDIGCGTGFSAGWFAQKGFEVEGSDLSTSMIEIAKRNHPKLLFSVADMLTFKPRKEANAVWAGYSMFHFDIQDFKKTVENIKSYLKPDGVFGLVMQEGEGEVEVPQPFLPGSSIYIRLYSEEELINILSEYGFEVIDQKRKVPKYSKELSYNKILFVGRLK